MKFFLSRNWRYSTADQPDFSSPSLDDSTWEIMHIPQNWFLGGLDHHGVVWFRREFIYQTDEEFTSLHFDGVDYYADVYLNGNHLGQHIGYFEPFNFDATGVLKTGKNYLTVRIVRLIS